MIVEKFPELEQLTPNDQLELAAELATRAARDGAVPGLTAGAVEALESQLDYYLKSDTRYEILSFITPYGNGLDLGPNGKTFTIDMSDYAPILKGEKLLTIEGVGNNQEELDLTFRFIEGTPAADVLEVKQLWPIRGASAVWSGYGFANIKADEVFEPRTLKLRDDAGTYKLRSVITGHGQNGEFTNQGHFMEFGWFN